MEKKDDMEQLKNDLIYFCIRWYNHSPEFVSEIFDQLEYNNDIENE